LIGSKVSSPMDTDAPPTTETKAAGAAARETQPAAADARGKLQVVISDEGFEAGRLNTVSIVVSNPFDVPVEILGIEAPRSSHLGRLAHEQTTTETVRKVPASDRATPSSTATVTKHQRPVRGWWWWWKEFFSGISDVALGSVSLGGMSVKFGERTESRFDLRAQESSTVEIDHSLADYDRVSVDVEKGATVKLHGAQEQRAKAASAAAEALAFEKARTILEPHCEIVAYLPLVTRNWLFFKPLRMNLTYLIRYRLLNDSGRILTQVVTSGLDVRPPLRSVVIGSIAGALLGATARFTQQISLAGGDVLDVITSHTAAEVIHLLGAAIMATIAAVALSRKSGAQSFITVEDFFGGFVIGVLIGYQGTSYFDTLVNHFGGNGPPGMSSPTGPPVGNPAPGR
jgi:hypothetical protein